MSQQQISIYDVPNRVTYDIAKALYLNDPLAFLHFQVRDKCTILGRKEWGREAEHKVLINTVKSLPGPLSSL